MFTHGMSAVGLSDDIGGEGADGVDGELVIRQGRETGHRSRLSLKDDGEGWEINRAAGVWLDRTLVCLYDLRESPRIFSLDRRRRRRDQYQDTNPIHPFGHHDASPGVRQVRYARFLLLQITYISPRDQRSARNSSKLSKPATLTTGVSGPEDATTTRTS